MPVMAPTVVCDGCNQEMSGYSKKELREDGWRFLAIRGRAATFNLCGDCYPAEKKP